MPWPRKAGRGPRGHSGWTSPEILGSRGQEEMEVTDVEVCVPTVFQGCQQQQDIKKSQVNGNYICRWVDGLSVCLSVCLSVHLTDSGECNILGMPLGDDFILGNKVNLDSMMN